VVSEGCVCNNTRVIKRGKKGLLKSQKEGTGLFLKLGYRTGTKKIVGPELRRNTAIP